MKHWKGITLLLLLLACALAYAVRQQMRRGPIYHGRRLADWVNQALSDDTRSEAFEMVLKIGSPAVPFIARRGLHDKCHTWKFLSYDRMALWSDRHPWLGRRLNMDNCVRRHSQARWLLFCLGTNAQPAVPDVIDCLEHCPQLHYTHACDLLDTLGAINGTNPASLPYLTRQAHQTNSLALRAATIAYGIDGRTNLMVETCLRLARTDPDQLIHGQELFWFRDDHELNKQLVPLLEKMYLDGRFGPTDRESILFELQSRSNDASAVLSRLSASGQKERPPTYENPSNPSKPSNLTTLSKKKTPKLARPAKH